MPRKTPPAYRRRIQRYSTNITSVVILCTVLGITVHASWNALVQPGEPLTASSWNAVVQEITRLGDDLAGLGTLATKSTVTSDDITDGTITNTDINASAGIATSKLSGAVTSITGHGLGSLATQSAVGNSNIADGVITFNKLATNLCTEGQVMKLNQHNQWACGEAAADLGTAAEQDVGTAAGNVVQLDGSARLPAVDGSQLTNLPSGGTPPASFYGYHTNDCNTATEGFVAMTGSLGLCFEKTERSASTWEAAWQTCINAGYRLPDYMEWKKACDGAAGAGLSGMTGNWEWASSTPSAGNNGSYRGAAAVIAGNSSCTSVDDGWVLVNSGYQNSYTFRCAR